VIIVLQSNSVAFRFRKLNEKKVIKRRSKYFSLTYKFKLIIFLRFKIKIGFVGNSFDSITKLLGAKLSKIIYLLNSTG